MSAPKLYKADFHFSLLFASDKPKDELKSESLAYLLNDLENDSAVFDDNVKVSEIKSENQVPNDLKDYGIWGDHDFVRDGGVSAKRYLAFLKEENSKESEEYKEYLRLKKKFGKRK